jgi:hypothetical protein
MFRARLEAAWAALFRDPDPPSPLPPEYKVDPNRLDRGTFWWSCKDFGNWERVEQQFADICVTTLSGAGGAALLDLIESRLIAVKEALMSAETPEQRERFYVLALCWEDVFDTLIQRKNWLRNNADLKRRAERVRVEGARKAALRVGGRDASFLG